MEYDVDFHGWRPKHAFLSDRCVHCGLALLDIDDPYCPSQVDQVTVPKKVLVELTDSARRWQNRSHAQRKKKMKWVHRARIAEIQVKVLREEVDRLRGLLDDHPT